MDFISLVFMSTDCPSLLSNTERTGSHVCEDTQETASGREIGVVFESTELAERMANGFDKKIDQVAFRLDLQRDDQGNEQIVWHGLIDGEQQTLSVDPYTSFWKRFGAGFMGIFPIESQI